MRQRLRPLTSNNNVTDEEILSEVTKIISDENEHQRRLGQVTCQRSAQAQSAGIEENDKIAKEQSSPTIKQLAAQVETLTNMVASLIKQQEAKPCQLSLQPPPNPLFQTQATPTDLLKRKRSFVQSVLSRTCRTVVIALYAASQDTEQWDV